MYKLEQEMKDFISNFMIDEVLSSNESGVVHENFFSDWEDAKSIYFGDFFEDSLIKSKPVTIKKPEKQLEAEISKALSEFSNPDNPLTGHFEKDNENYKFTFDNNCFRYSPYVFSIKELAENKVDRPILIYDKKADKYREIPSGTKVSRALKYFIADKNALAEAQAFYSSFFNDANISGYLHLSIHPLDYLTMSVNNSGWRSCLNAYDGEYRGGIGALMNSSNTLVCYLTTTEEDTCELRNGTFWNDKKWRTLITIDDTTETIHVNTHYPYENTNLEKIAMDWCQEIFFKETEMETVSREEIGIHYSTGELMYNDASCKPTRLRISKPNFLAEKKVFDVITICDLATCPDCGVRHDFSHDNLECGDCYEGGVCEDCGCPIDTEYATWIDDYGYVCDCCLDSYYGWCEDCESYHALDDLFTVNEGTRNERWVCTYCFNHGDYGYCSCCEKPFDGDLLYSIDENSDYLCAECLEEEKERIAENARIAREGIL